MMDAGIVVIRKDTRRPRVDCIDCLPEIEAFIGSAPVRGGGDVPRLRQQLRERFSSPPVVAEIG
jgi:hypothetical protein